MKFILTLLLVAQFATAEELKEIKLGFMATLTGNFEMGTDMQKGSLLALKEVNELAKKDGYKLKPIYEDFGNLDLRKAVSAAHKLININKVDIFYPFVSEDVEVVWRIGEKAKLPMIAVRPGGITVGEFSPYLVRMSANDSILYDKVMDYAMKQGYKKIAILSSFSGYYTPMTKYTAKQWEERTGEKPLVLEYQIGDTDFYAGLLKIKQFNPDLIFTISFDQSYMYQQARRLGLRVPFMGVYLHLDTRFATLPESIKEGIIYPNYYGGDQNFVKKYQKEFKQEPGESSPYAYDAVKVTFKCLKENNYQTDKLIQCILSLKDFPGATGLINLTKDGDRIANNVQLYEFRDGKSVAINNN